MADTYSVLKLITPHRFGGAERVAANLARALIDRGHRVVVAGPPREPLFLDYLRQLGVPFEPLGISGKLNPLAPGRIYALAGRLGAQIIHTYLSSASRHGIAAARRLGLPSVAHVHGMNSPRWYRGATVVLGCTQGVIDHLRARGLRGHDTRVIYNGLPPAAFEGLPSPAAVRAEVGLAPEDRTVGVLAALVARKGHRHLLDALARLRGDWPRLHCLVIGEGPLLAQLQAQAADLGIADRLHWLGWRNDAPSLLQTLDLLVLPATEIESFGLCIIEAAFVGVPSVASDLPGVDEAVVDGQTGLLVPVGDSAALAEAIGGLLADDDRRRSLGEAARRRAREEFTIERMARDVEALYRELIQGRAE